MTKIGIIGMGKIGKKYYQLIDSGQIANAEIGGLCRWEFPSYTDLIDSGECDSVIVCTPHSSHYDIGKYALNAGLKTLVDKPLSLKENEYQELIDLGAYTAFNTKFEGKLYAEKEIQWHVNWYRPESYYSGWRGIDGHILWTMSIHNIELLLWSFGYPKIIYSYTDHYNIDCLLDFNGIKCEYRASTNQQDFPEFLKIDGEISKRRKHDHITLLQKFVDNTLEKPTMDIYYLIQNLLTTS